jgi:hypothetical protein
MYDYIINNHIYDNIYIGGSTVKLIDHLVVSV